MEKYIIIDLATSKALYGYKEKTLLFSTYEIAQEVAIQFFATESKYYIAKLQNGES